MLGLVNTIPDIWISQMGNSSHFKGKEIMPYKWKPNKAQKAAYREKMQERDSLQITPSCGAIRTGCEVSFYSVNKGGVISGTVVKHSYGAERNQHTFTIESEGIKVLVKGRNLYPNLITHNPGEESQRV